MMEAVVKMKNPSMTRKEKKSKFFPIWFFFIIFDSEIRMAEEMDDDDGGSDSESDSENAIELLDHGKWPWMTLIDFDWPWLTLIDLEWSQMTSNDFVF